MPTTQKSQQQKGIAKGKIQFKKIVFTEFSAKIYSYIGTSSAHRLSVVGISPPPSAAFIRCASRQAHLFKNKKLERTQVHLPRLCGRRKEP